MGAIYVLWLRELKRYFRSRAQIAASLGQPLLYLLALGSASPRCSAAAAKATTCSSSPRA